MAPPGLALLSEGETRLAPARPARAEGTRAAGSTRAGSGLRSVVAPVRGVVAAGPPQGRRPAGEGEILLDLHEAAGGHIDRVVGEARGQRHALHLRGLNGQAVTGERHPGGLQGRAQRAVRHRGQALVGPRLLEGGRNGHRPCHVIGVGVQVGLEAVPHARRVQRAPAAAVLEGVVRAPEAGQGGGELVVLGLGAGGEGPQVVRARRGCSPRRRRARRGVGPRLQDRGLGLLRGRGPIAGGGALVDVQQVVDRLLHSPLLGPPGVPVPGPLTLPVLLRGRVHQELDVVRHRLKTGRQVRGVRRLHVGVVGEHPGEVAAEVRLGGTHVRGAVGAQIRDLRRRGTALRDKRVGGVEVEDDVGGRDRIGQEDLGREAADRGERRGLIPSAAAGDEPGPGRRRASAGDSSRTGSAVRMTGAARGGPLPGTLPPRGGRWNGLGRLAVRAGEADGFGGARPAVDDGARARAGVDDGAPGLQTSR